MKLDSFDFSHTFFIFVINYFVIGNNFNGYHLLTKKFKWAKKKKNLHQRKENQSSLYSLNTLLGVTSKWCETPWLCARAHTSRLQQCESLATVGDLIG